MAPAEFKMPGATNAFVPVLPMLRHCTLPLNTVVVEVVAVEVVVLAVVVVVLVAFDCDDVTREECTSAESGNRIDAAS